MTSSSNTSPTQTADPLGRMRATLQSVRHWSEWPDEGDLCSIEAGIAEIERLHIVIRAAREELEPGGGGEAEAYLILKHSGTP